MICKVWGKLSGGGCERDGGSHRTAHLKPYKLLEVGFGGRNLDLFVIMYTIFFVLIDVKSIKQGKQTVASKGNVSKKFENSCPNYYIWH